MASIRSFMSEDVAGVRADAGRRVVTRVRGRRHGPLPRRAPVVRFHASLRRADVRVIRAGERPGRVDRPSGGVAARRPLALGRVPRREVADVLWLQVGRYFCDLRTPLSADGRHPHRSGSAAGLQRHRRGRQRVPSRSITTSTRCARDPAHPDEGTVHRKDDVMYERGPGLRRTLGPHVASRRSTWRSPSCADRRLGGLRWRASCASARSRSPSGVARHPGGAQFSEVRRLGQSSGRSGTIDATLAVDRAVRIGRERYPLPTGWVTIDPGEV